MASDTTHSPSLHAKRGDVNYFKELGLNLLAKDEYGNSLLSTAAMYGHLSCCQVIYRRCPRLLYVRNIDGVTPLHLAAYNGHNDVVNYLFTARATLERGAGIVDDKLLMMASNYTDETALHFASKRDHLKSAELLLGADRNKKLLGMVDISKSTALHVAVKFKHLEIVKVLVEADPNFEYSADNDGKTPLFIAWEEALSGDERAVEIRNFLIHRQSSQCAVRTGLKGWTIIHHTASKGDLSAIEEIIRSNPSCSELLRMTDNSKSTALHLAVKNQHLEIVKLLVEADPDFEYSADDQGKTPLLIALNEAVYRDPKTVKIRSYLIEKQSRQCMAPTGQEEWTLLHHAASKQELGAMEEIIQSCPDCLALVDKKGQNFLHLAVSSEHIDVVNYILGNPKIDDSVLNRTDNNGNTPLHLATIGGSVSISLSLLYDSRVRKMIQNNDGKSALEAIDFVYDLSRAKVEGFPGLVDLKQLKDRSDFDLLVGALIATVSFTAGITVPGGFFSDGPSRGNAILYKKRTFEAFVVFNTIALALSLFVVLSHFCLRRLVNKKNILLQLQMATFSLMGAILAMMVAFIMGSFAVLSISPGLSITVCLICCCFFGASGYCLWMMIGDKVKHTGRSS